MTATRGDARHTPPIRVRPSAAKTRSMKKTSIFPADLRFISLIGDLVAYSSGESGQFEVHVTTFPSHDQDWPVSSSGGSNLAGRNCAECPMSMKEDCLSRQPSSTAIRSYRDFISRL